MKRKQSHGSRQNGERETPAAITTKKNNLVAGDSMLTGISEKGFSKKHNLSVTGFSGGTNEKYLIIYLLKGRSDDMLIYTGTNDITSGNFTE